MASSTKSFKSAEKLDDVMGKLRQGTANKKTQAERLL